MRSKKSCRLNKSLKTKKNIRQSAAVIKSEIYTPSRIAEIKEWVKDCETPTEAYKIIEEKLGKCRDHVRRLNNKYGFWMPYKEIRSNETGNRQEKWPDTSRLRTSFVKNGEENETHYVTVDHPVSLEEVVKQCGVNCEQWSVKGFGIGGPNKRGNFTWRVSFEKKKIDNVERVALLIKDLKEDIEKKSGESAGEKKNTVTSRKEENDSAGGYLLEISIMDAHLGKLSWHEETGSSYDLKIARAAYLDTIRDLLLKAASYCKIGRILACCGNDYLNADSMEGETTAGTKQDMDSRFGKVYREARQTLVQAIDMMKQIAPVDIVVQPGNHDSISLFTMGDSLECYYHDEKGVTVNNSAFPRKYYRFGQTLIAFAHGDKESLKKLPLLGAVENKKDWAECKYIEWHTGHKHMEQVSEDMGIKVRILPSITAPDFWHSSMGYVGNVRNAQAFLYHKDNGLEAIFYSKPVKEIKD